MSQWKNRFDLMTFRPHGLSLMISIRNLKTLGLNQLEL